MISEPYSETMISEPFTRFRDLGTIILGMIPEPLNGRFAEKTVISEVKRVILS